jgi:hypothetical protein
MAHLDRRVGHWQGKGTGYRRATFVRVDLLSFSLSSQNLGSIVNPIIKIDRPCRYVSSGAVRRANPTGSCVCNTYNKVGRAQSSKCKKKVYILNIAILTLSFVIPRARVYDMRRAHTPKIDICHIKKKDPTANVGLPKLVSAVEGSRGASLIYSQLAFYRRCTVKGQSEPLQWRRLSGTVKSPTSN